MTVVLRFATIICLVVCPPLAQAASQAGTTAGQFAVDANGAATYTIPLQVPPGINGLEPKLALTYNSAQGNGLLGVGGELSGLSSISRCPGTIAIDGARKGISFSEERFCLDGARLINICSRTGVVCVADGTGGSYREYRTEIESFVRIRAYGADAMRPTHFRVWTKSGEVREYGNTADSRYLVNGTGALQTWLTWGVNKISDRQGNYLTVSYVSSTEFRPSSIVYGDVNNATSTATAKREVVFDYESRTDTATRYVAGLATSVTQRLKTITTKYANTIVRTYNLAYDNEATGAARSRLTSITECGGGTLSTGDCYSTPITFGWRASGSLGYTAQSTFANLVSGADYSKFNQLVDMNGDGLTDIVSASSTTAKVYLAKAGGGYDGAKNTASAVTAPTTSGEGMSQWNELADVNGDGLMDILRVSNTSDGTLQLRLGMEDGTFAAATTLTEKARIDASGFRYYNQLIDMNGDGLMDLVSVSGTAQFTIRYGQLVSGAFSFRAAGNPTAGVYFAPYPGGVGAAGFRARNMFADVNGDGRVDLLTSPDGNDKIQVMIANGSGGFDSMPEKAGVLAPSRSGYFGRYLTFLNQFVDVNGDGSLDVVRPATQIDTTAALKQGRVRLGCYVHDQSDFHVSYWCSEAVDIYSNPIRMLSQPSVWLGDGKGGFAAASSSPGTILDVGDIVLQPKQMSASDLAGYNTARYCGTSSQTPANPQVPEVQSSTVVINGVTYPYKTNWYYQSYMTDVRACLANQYEVSPTSKGISHRNQFADVDNDGAIDIISADASGNTYVAYGNGQGAFANRVRINDVTTANATAGFRAWNELADLNGDGIVDFFTVSGTTGTPRWSTFKRPGLVEKVTDGNGLISKATYAPLSDANAYWKTTGADAYPSRKITVPLYVVTKAEQTDSTTAATFNYAKQYRYKNLRIDYQRGWSGFAEVAQVDLNSGPTAPGYSDYNITTHTRYRQDYPFIGRVDKIIQTHDGDLLKDMGSLTRKLSETSITWNSSAETNVSVVFEDLRTEQVNSPSETSGTYSQVITHTTDYQDSDSDGKAVDAYGNPEIIAQSNSADVHVVTTTYTNNYQTGSDFLGQLSTQTVVTTHTTPAGGSKPRSVARTFYADGSLDTETNESGTTLAKATQFTYDSFGQVQAAKISGWDGSYDNNGNAQAATAIERSVTYGYAKQDQRDWERTETTTVNGVNLVTTTTIDGYFGRPKLVSDPNGIAAATGYDKLGRLTSQVAYSNNAGNALTTTTSYASTCPSGVSCATGARLYVTATPPTKAGSVLVTQYDALAREIRRATKDYNAAYVHVDTLYDGAGRVAAVSRPCQPACGATDTAVWTASLYDNAGRLVTTTAPNGAVVSRAYAGLQTTTTRTTADESAQATTTTVDSQGNIVRVVDANGHTTDFEYEPFGLLARVIPDTSSSRYTITRGYDVFGNLTSQADPDMGTWQYRYNAFGELKWQKDAKGQITSFGFDVIGRMTTRTEGTGTGAKTTTWTYDNATKGKGLLDTVTRDGITTAYGYDAVKRPTSESTTVSGATYTVTTAYGAAHGQIESVTYPNSGPVVKYEYFDNGLLKRITDNAATPVEYWRADSYDLRNQLLTEKWGNLIPGTRVYDPTTGTLTSIKSGTGDNIQSVTYKYYQSGNLKLRENANANFTERFAYDRLNRLSSVVPSAGTSISYDYDDYGNLKYKSGVGGFNYGETGSGAGPHAVSSIKFDAAHGTAYTDAQLQATVDDVLGRATSGLNCEAQQGHPTETIDALDVLCIAKRIADSNAGGVSYSYTYDSNGNMLTGAGRTVTYTLFNKPATIAANGATTTFTYGPGYERVVKRINRGGVITTHTSLGGVYEKIVKSTGTEHRFYIRAGSRLVAQVSKVGSTLTTQYAHTDLLGSVDALTVKSGSSYTIAESASFAEFGEPRLGTWAKGTPAFAKTTQGYTGHEMDAESGLINMNARLYDPLIGRFVTADSVIPDVYDPQSLNRYSYVLNNPFGYTDPTGHVPYDTGYDWNHGAGSGGTGPSLGSTLVGNAIGGWSGAGVPSPLPVAVPYANDVGMGLASPVSMGMQPVAGMQGGGEWQLDFRRAGGGSAQSPFGRIAWTTAEAVVPGLHYSDQAVKQAFAGNYGMAAANLGAAFAEVGMAIYTLGGSQAELAAARMAGTFAAREAAPSGSALAAETPGVLKQGELINRVWDSRWTPGSRYSGPYGGSYSPTGSLPINAAEAIRARGLNVPGVRNNAERGALYEVTRDVPALLRTSLGGDAPEIIVAPGERDALRLIEESISRIPAGR